MKNDKTRESIILGALLHDIGKFAQRAGISFTEESQKLAFLCKWVRTGTEMAHTLFPVDRTKIGMCH